MILIPVDSMHALLLAGKGLANADRIMQTVEGMLFVRGDVANVLQSLGVSPAPVMAAPAVPAKEAGVVPGIPVPAPVEPEEELEPELDVDLDVLFGSAAKKSEVKDLDAFWDDAVEKTAGIPTNPDVITFDEARKLGLDPANSPTIPLRQTGSLKKR